ncbi:caspase-3-like [Dendropsophus ebraccatus]|uniref:caspase-3-like n=1 Tax=Dendropsophus ebraccatus TaxID=150705 RepID=UPI003831D9CA
MAEPAGVSSPSPQTGSDEMKYNMDYPEKGLCLIINMENFASGLGLKPRKGTSIDEKAVEDVFKAIGFTIQTEKDKTSEDIYNIMVKVAEDDHSKRSCFVCVIMSHGEEGTFYGFDKEITEAKLFTLFNGENCPSLAGKPKLFFLQKCRGKSVDAGVTLHTGSEGSGTTIPIEADFLYHYAAPSGYVSYRRNDGSWFIQSLCKMLERYWNNKELLHILTLVNHKVAYEYNSTDERSRHKQAPCIVSRLTQFLYL